MASTETTNQSTGASALTLGELLYTDTAITCVPEKDWLALVRAIAAGEEIALRLLFEKTYPLVFTYLMRLTADRRVTEELVLQVFEDLWCEAPIFDGARGPVLGWIMMQARSRALAHARSAEPLQTNSGLVVSLLNDATRADVGSHRSTEDVRLHAAIEALTMREREAIEAALLNGLSYADVAAQRGESVGTIKQRIRSGLRKVRQTLQERGHES